MKNEHIDGLPVDEIDIEEMGDEEFQRWATMMNEQVDQLKEISREQSRLTSVMMIVFMLSAIMIGICVYVAWRTKDPGLIEWSLALGSLILWEGCYRFWLEPWRKRLKKRGEELILGDA